MTIREKMTRLLEDNGLMPDQAQAIMELAIVDVSLESMVTRWNDESEGYPPQLFGAIWYPIKKVAVEWIDANIPQHFARAIFAN